MTTDKARRHETPARIVTFCVMVAFLFILAFSGGASRGDALSQVVIRTASILSVLIVVVMSGFERLSIYRVPLLFVVAMAALIAVQLMPLPYALWSNLAGRADFAMGDQLAGLGRLWRPLNLTPDAGWNSLFSLLPAFAAITLFACLSAHRRIYLLLSFAVMALLSGVMGLLQLADPGSPLYFYRVQSRGFAVGLFANRNHQALLLVMALPILAALLLRWRTGRVSILQRFLIFAAASAFLLPLIVITGSRAGMIAMPLGLAAAAALFWHRRKELFGSPKGKRDRRMPLFMVLAAGVVPLALIGLGIMSSRAVGIQRLFDKSFEADERLAAFPVFFDVAKTYFPWGSGFGSFPAIYQVAEPTSLLGYEYFNHAHSDLLEIVIEGGIVGLLLLVAFISWWGWRSFGAWRNEQPPQHEPVMLARLGSVVIGILLLGSIVDYPLRTPIMSVLFVLSCCWLCLPGGRGVRAAPPDGE